MNVLRSLGIAALASAAVVGFAYATRPAPAASLRAPAAADKDVVEIAMAAGNFTTLTAALKAAGWVDQLKGKGPFTVFSPTDEAFRKLPPGTVETWLKPENHDK